MPNVIIGQVLGILATVICFISYQTNTKKNILFTQLLMTLCICLSFLFLGAYTGFALNIIGLVRNVTYYFVKEKTKTHYLAMVLLTISMIIVGISSWHGPVSLFIIIALAVNTVFLGIGNPQLLRKSMLFTSSLIIICDIFVLSIGGIANESVAIVSSIIGILRYKNKS